MAVPASFFPRAMLCRCRSACRLVVPIGLHPGPVVSLSFVDCDGAPPMPAGASIPISQETDR
jgi:hypothetical protein